MELGFLTISELQNALQCGDLTSEALITGLLSRIGMVDPNVNAFVEVYGEEALLAARQSDQRRSRGELRSNLDGVPFAAKDLFDVQGHITLAGSKALPATPAAETAHAIAQLIDKGMILLGKTHTVEFAYGSWGTNPSSKTPVNPFDLDVARVPGGSSSGSGVAVAAGLVPVALGTDTGGSARTPAALCGVVGLKTSVGAIGRSGVRPLALLFDAVGPMTRSVEDAATILSALQGEDWGDPSTMGLSLEDPTVDLDRGVAELVLRYPPIESLSVAEPGILARFRETLSEFKEMGAVLEEKPLPRPLETYATVTANMITVEAWGQYQSIVEAQDSLVDPEIAKRMSRGAQITLSDYLGYLEQRRVMQDEFQHYLSGADALLIPTSPITAKPLEGIHDTAAPFGLFTRFANLMDLAAVSIPMGFAGSLPTGVQIVVRRYSDHLALRVARALEMRRGGLFVAPSGYTSAGKHQDAN
ncbi:MULTISPECIES: amidase [unclassified Neorhizobium]|uniref:amidase n=1 Tax=unclassified Neorhizobium TaxID=2629175 RepID=UPI001FF13A2C|nr:MULTISPECIES: amidase [unclassified Neorhizobium]MCJ9670047.1 amidase [Neorhizobium sp. SHOUNA12B]MCJ9746032.1 amidase [Neorhizobium sp. SHOUNA12A]